MDEAKRKIEALGYDVLSLKDVRYIKAGIDDSSSTAQCTQNCKSCSNNCISCQHSCSLGGKG